MKKINVIGTSGSGKSHFSIRLAEKLHIPYIEMDAIYWQQNWQGLETSEFLIKVQDIMHQPAFVLDGNHSKTNAVKWSSVDTVIWLDLGFWRTFAQILLRSIKRASSKNEIWQDTGNKESFYRSFFSSKSVIWWMLKNYWKTKAKYKRLFEEMASGNIQVIRLVTRADVESFLASIDLANT